MKNYKVDDEAIHLFHGRVKIVATKDSPRIRKNMTPLTVPEHYDYLVVGIPLPTDGTINTIIPANKEHLNPVSDGAFD